MKSGKKSNKGLEIKHSENQAAWKQTLAAITDYLKNIRNVAVSPTASIETVKEYVSGPRFENPLSPKDAISFIVKGLSRFHLNTAHPSYYGVFNPPSSTMGIIADTLVAAYNPQLASWVSSPFAVEIEDHLIREIGSLFGFDSVEGCFTSGGAEANHTAVLASLVRFFPGYIKKGTLSFKKRPLIYVSSEYHHSFLKAARLSGIGEDSLREISVGKDLKFDEKKLEEKIVEDSKYGFSPFLLIATAGTTSAGIVDRIESLSRVAKKFNLWFHLDAAWGGAAILDPRLSKLFKGTNACDSITIDAHKWFSVPMGAGIFLTKNRGTLEKTFNVETSYMPQRTQKSKMTQPYKQSMQWSRRFMGLKLYLTLLVAGWEGYRKTIQHQIDMGNYLRHALLKNRWHIVNKTELPVICFWPGKEAPSVSFVEKFAEEIALTGKAWITTANLSGLGPVLRAGIPNFRTEEADIEKLVQILNEVRSKLSGDTPTKAKKRNRVTRSSLER